jgi:hypothetical protein
MKKLKLKDTDHDFYYANDIDRIVKIFSDRGYEITPTDAAHAWELYSDSMAAGWMCLDSLDDDVFLNVFFYFKEVE